MAAQNVAGVQLDTTVLDRIAKDLNTNTDRILAALAGEVKQNAQTSMVGTGKGKSHVPSAPGQPPTVDTGALKNSIDFRRVRRGLYYVEDGVDYGVFLELGHSSRPFRKSQGVQRWIEKRPFMVPAMEKMRKHMSEKWKGLFK